MKNTTAILSMLHEGSAQNSATRRFRGEAVLRWTLNRLSRAKQVQSVAVLCWEDQLEQVVPHAGAAYVLAKGPRAPLPELDAVTAARRWSDGWRGGLLSTCDFDLGFYGPWFAELAANVGSESVLLVDPSSALVDPAVLDNLVAHADSHPQTELFFVPAAPGLGGALIRENLLRQLAKARTHCGRLLHYLPDQISREPLAGESCAPVATAAARTTQRFKLDSERQIARMSAAMVSLNGHLISSSAEELVSRAHAWKSVDPLPREVVLEINTERATRPIWWPGSYHTISRPPIESRTAQRLFADLASLDDTRLTLAGVGDPCLADHFFEIVDAAIQVGSLAVHVETDLHNLSADFIAQLAAAKVDVISVHLPALNAGTYQKIMGVDGFEKVLESLRDLVAARGAGRVPIIVPTFTKCRENMAEMEAWYDQWLSAIGCAVIRGPSDYAGQTPDVAVADMSPPRRTPCARLASRLTVLSDGRVVSCEQDVLARQPLGDLSQTSIMEIWQKPFSRLRQDHQQSKWESHPTCSSCKEWHRP